MVVSPLWAQQEQFSPVDTLFNKMTLEDLIKIKKYFESKAQELQNQGEDYLSEGIEWGENFLKEEGRKVRNRDVVYIRLAEYYIEDAERAYEKEVDEYDKKLDEYERQLALFDQGKIEKEPTAPEFPSVDYTKAIELYDRLLKEFPTSKYADAALYTKAWLLERMGRGEESRKVYREVVEKYPESPFAPEAYMRLAEYYFAPREDKKDEQQIVIELQKAIQLYKNVLRYKKSKRYDEALYKLGWSYYKLASRDPKYYNDAILYFIAVADDIVKARKYDPNGEISNPEVFHEAVQYIGISLTDENYVKNGVERAAELLQKIGDREYGPEIFKAMGETYERIDEGEKAIVAYTKLLEMYPYYENAPEIQQHIVDVLYQMGKDEEAYQARLELFEKYNPQSEWYQKLENSDNLNKVQYLNKAYKLSESALRTNLVIDLQKAEEKFASGEDATPLYEQFAKHCETYLTYFPADSNAYEVNWSYAYMLDTRLNRFKDAFEEYIKVSNDYLETEHQHQAALNAVFVADTLVEMRFGRNDTTQFNLANPQELIPEELSPEESMLIEAYNNYLRLFPYGDYAPNFLAAAGGIFYNHKMFAEAKVYFQTLVKRFPNAAERSLALRSIMDSYFALGRFKDSEAIARRILAEENLPEEQKEFALKRMGQAIFKNAEYYEQQGDFFNAGMEFLRVYQEAPADPKLVEAALFNSGLNFQKAKDWVRSNESFNILATEYPDSKYAIPALENMAKNFVEMENYVDAAKTYERIYNTYTDTPNAEPALYNASVYYQKGESWEDAIRVNDMYITRFPNLPYATDLFFQNASLYLKLNNLAEANRIYQEFANKFPDDPRTVTAFYERGKYYYENGMPEQAKVELNKAIQKSEALQRAGKDANAYIAAEAVNLMAEILHQDFLSIELKQPPQNIQANLNKLKALMKELNETYRKVIAYASPRSFEATFNIAKTFEEFADKYISQEIDPNLNADQKFVAQLKINEQGYQLYDRAVEEYKNVIQVIPALAEKLGIDLTQPEEEVTAQADTASNVMVTRVAEIDSARQLAIKWHEKAKSKISQLLFKEAEITASSLYHTLEIKAPFQRPLEIILFKVQLFDKAAKPAVQKSIQAHLRNIQESEELGLSNKYVEESKRQILLISNVLAEQYEALAHYAIDNYKTEIEKLIDLIEKDYGEVNEFGEDYYAVDNNANQMIDFSNELSQSSIKSYQKTLELALQYNIQNDLIKTTKNNMIRLAVEITDRMGKEADEAKEKVDYYQVKFDSTQNYNYDDAAGFFENYLVQFTNYSKDILDLAYEMKKTYDIKNIWVNKLIFKLIKLDPLAYSEEVEKERIVIQTDSTWVYSTVYYPEQWNQVDFDDSDWLKPEVLVSYDNQFADLGVNPDAIWTRFQTLDTLSFSAQDSAFFSDSTNIAGGELDTLVFFRKAFYLDGKPVAGNIYVTADDDFRIYLNGEYLLDDEKNDYSVLDTLDFFTFEFYLKQGKNVLAIDVEDKDMTRGGVKLYAYIENLPADILKAAEAKATEKRIVVDPAILKRINTLHKNRIALKGEF
ncbi:tetratricopeptide repeat protein [Caldithrix abyssi]|uniref:tetratricopeptide repeat protein n=1 Tax=Caldithrix abyssi TaxID=187145 RepID=UPI001470DCAB|nr:tetratricopeptide repeat protein [Caldithrix abyssi]